MALGLSQLTLSPIYPLSLSLLLSLLTSIFISTHPPSSSSASRDIVFPGDTDIWSPTQYSYIGPDFPISLPIPMPLVEMSFGPSTHYQIGPPFNPNLTDFVSSSTPTSTDGDTFQTSQWYTTDTASGGFIRLGPPRRAFAISMFHQLHCITAFQRALQGKFLTEEGMLHYMDQGMTESEAKKHATINDPTADYGHVHHCVNYLRQAFLCAADDTLEEGDFMDDFLTKDEDTDDDAVFAEGKTFNKVCRDWSALYDFADRNHIEFHEYRSQVGYGEWE